MLVKTAAVAGRMAREVVQAARWAALSAPGIVGAGLIVTGVGLVYRPAAFIVGGAFLLAADWRASR